MLGTHTVIGIFKSDRISKENLRINGTLLTALRYFHFSPVAAPNTNVLKQNQCLHQPDVSYVGVVILKLQLLAQSWPEKTILSSRLTLYGIVNPVHQVSSNALCQGQVEDLRTAS